MLNQRAKILLKTLVERYISEGQPVGSRSLSKFSGLDLSPATIRNVMADLEEMGFVASPHTSAGRIPTHQGYRFFVDTLLVVKASGSNRNPSTRRPVASKQSFTIDQLRFAIAIGIDALCGCGGDSQA